MSLSIPSPSELISGGDIVTVFQSLYNLGFAIFVALAFLSFVYGAFQYLLSGANIFNQQEGKNRMKSSLIALIIVLIIPPILNLINPKIFQGVEMQIPRLTVKLPEVVKLDVVETSEKDMTDDYILNKNPTPHHSILSYVAPAPSRYPSEWRWGAVFRGQRLSNIRISGNDRGTEYVNPILRERIVQFNNDLSSNNLFIIVTDGYSVGDHSSADHTKYGTAIDIVVTDKSFKPLSPDRPEWSRVINLAGRYFNVLDERFKRGSEYWSGSHIHLYVRVLNTSIRSR